MRPVSTISDRAWWRRWRSGWPGRWRRRMRRCSSTGSLSPFATAKSETGPLTPPSAWPLMAPAASLGFGSGRAVRAPSSPLQVLTEVKSRGTTDVCVVCDGLKSLPEAIEANCPPAVVQTCVLHLIRHTFRLASRKDWDGIARDLWPAYTATTEEAATERLPRTTKARGHLPDEQAASKSVYLAVRSVDPTGRGRRRWINGGELALNAFQITFEGRLLLAGE